MRLAGGDMIKEWQELTKLTGDESIIVERVKLKKSGIVIEGEFELPQLARFSNDDQVFIASFLASHGNIKQMEKTFGISYPTVKNRLNRIADKFDFIKIDTIQEKNEILEQLERGELTVEQALKALKEKNK
jgi:hypothetical protein